MQFALLMLAFFLYFTACRDNKSAKQDTTTPSNDSLPAIQPDTVKSPEPTRAIGEIKYLDNNMRLVPVDSVAKGMVIRLYMTTLLKPDLLITVTINDSAVIGKMYDYYVSPDSVFHSKLSDRSPRHPLTLSLRGELSAIDFRNIHSQQGVKSIADGNAEGILYSMEVATSSYHKVIRFHCPEKLVERDHDCKAFVDVLAIIDKYMRFRMPYCQ